MSVTWYCVDCDARVQRREIEAHEANGHHVKGHIRPERLLPAEPVAMEAGRSDDLGD